ncbi:zinc finger CCCH domain-containing protein 15 [Medicago truncatula]|uniref:zinc finger CCCH domain-containing protein 15 n=1 Tax=Medicago truncatula TaxID=3880 RepID=UPI0019681CFF|nr:zinc finger CCCH domain-containing protein 15 [Medicago truncatula]
MSKKLMNLDSSNNNADWAQQDSLNRVQLGMFKTGTCPYGDHCQFAHGIGELRQMIRHPRYKTEVCRMVLAGVVCPCGHRCHFRHALTEQEKAMFLLKCSFTV